MKCFLYMRCSGASQIDGDTWDRQSTACEKYAASHDLEITKVFRDEAVSGSRDLDNRPALIDLLAECQESGVKTIIIERLDRLARDLMISETIIAEMRKKGYTIISTTEPDLCSDDPSRKLMRQIFGAISEFEKTMIVLKLRAARQRKRARGERVEGRKPYGKTPEEASILADMRSLREGGMIYSRIAETLNRHGIMAREGGAWKTGTVAKILSDKRARQNNAPVLRSAA